MIQDIYPHKLDISYRPGWEAEDGSLIVRFRGRCFMCRKDEDGSVALPEKRAFADLSSDLVYLFELDGKSVFLDTKEGGPCAGGYAYEDISAFRTGKSGELMLVAVTAYHLFVWYKDNAFCGRCGGKTVHDKKERMLRCPACGNTVYPRIMPSVIAGVVRDDSLLLTRYNREGATLSALVAGICEIGESAEDTVRREVMEETGLKVKSIRYYASQPWGVTAGGLLLGYFCEADGNGDITVDGDEIAEAAWVKREDFNPGLTPGLLAFSASQSSLCGPKS